MPLLLGLVTGYPGWLTGRLLGLLGKAPAAAWQEELARYRWRVMVAPGAQVDRASLPPSVAEVCVGDVRDPNAVRQAVQGAELVLHAAGLIHPRRIAELYAVNRDGAAGVALAAARAGVRRLVFVSSNAAAGFAPDAATPRRESDPPRPASHYGRSKLQGEQALWQALGTVQGVVLRPTTFYGPHFPRRHLRAYQLAQSGRPLFIGDGRNSVSLVYLDDLVAGVGLALTRPEAAGQTYFLAGEKPYLWQEVFLAMGRALGVQARPRHLPGRIAVLCNALDRGLGALGYYSLHLHLAGEATRHMGCCIDKARQELGYCPAVGLDQGMGEAVRWAREKGWL